MPEALKMVHLTPAQRGRKSFYHPLTNNAPPYLSDEQLDQLLSDYFKLDTADTFRVEITETLIVNYFRSLRGIVARYLYHWPLTRRFLDEMVSTGAEAIVKVVTNLTLKKLEERELINWIDGAIRFNIETVINNLRGVVAASRTTNFDRERVGRLPVYGNVEADLTTDAIKDSKAYIDIGLLLFELEDALEVIAQTELEKRILAEENWGLSHIEVGLKLGVSPEHVGRLRNCLRDHYDKLGEKHVQVYN